MATSTDDPDPTGDVDDGAADRPRRRVATQLELPWRTVVRVLLLLAALWLALRLWQLGLQLVLAALLAAALEPAVRWLQRRRLPRPLAVAVLVGGTLLGVVGVLLALPAAAAVPVIEKIWVPERYRRKADAREVAALLDHDIEIDPETTAGWPG